MLRTSIHYGTHTYSASHVVLLLVKKYPLYNIINLDRLDCKSFGCVS